VNLFKRFFGFVRQSNKNLDDLKSSLQQLSVKEMNTLKGGKSSVVSLDLWNRGCGGITPQ